MWPTVTRVNHVLCVVIKCCCWPVTCFTGFAHTFMNRFLVGPLIGSFTELCVAQFAVEWVSFFQVTLQTGLVVETCGTDVTVEAFPLFVNAQYMSVQVTGKIKFKIARFTSKSFFPIFFPCFVNIFQFNFWTMGINLEMGHICCVNCVLTSN